MDQLDRYSVLIDMKGEDQGDAAVSVAILATAHDCLVVEGRGPSPNGYSFRVEGTKAHLRAFLYQHVDGYSLLDYGVRHVVCDNLLTGCACFDDDPLPSVVYPDGRWRCACDVLNDKDNADCRVCHSPKVDPSK